MNRKRKWREEFELAAGCGQQERNQEAQAQGDPPCARAAHVELRSRKSNWASPKLNSELQKMRMMHVALCMCVQRLCVQRCPAVCARGFAGIAV